jgi:hypothetical protein
VYASPPPPPPVPIVGACFFPALSNNLISRVCPIPSSLLYALVQVGMDWVGDFDDNSANSTTYNNTPIAANIIIGTLLLFWVAILEGAQCSIVGLTCIKDLETIRESHPSAYQCCKIVHAGPNVEKFIVGRQFLLLFLVFIITKLFGHSKDRMALDGTPTDADGPYSSGKYNGGDFYMGEWAWQKNADLAFLQNSILLMIVIIVPGNLVSQLLAAGKMLAFLELSFFPLYTVVYPSMFMEWIGFTHCAYVIKDLVAWISGKKEVDKTNKNWFHYLRCVYSVVAVIFAATVVIYGLLNGKTNCWDTLPGGNALVLSLFFMFFIGCCEGFQIAAMKLSRLPASQLESDYPVAHKVIIRLFAGNNLKRFLVGRQVFVAMMMVLLGRVTSFKNNQDVWGFKQWAMDGFLETGILGAIFVVNVGQLSFRMLASTFPVIFINSYIMYGLLEIALAVEATGVFNSCWVLAWGMDAILKMPEDPDFQGPTLVRMNSFSLPIIGGVAPFDMNVPDEAGDDVDDKHPPPEQTVQISIV